MQLDGDPGPQQALGVVARLVAQRVELGVILATAVDADRFQPDLRVDPDDVPALAVAAWRLVES